MVGERHGGAVAGGNCYPIEAASGCRFFAVSVHRWPWRLVVMVSGNGGREARRHRSGADHCGNCYPIEARPAVAGSLPCLFIGNRYGQRFNRLAVWRFSVPVCRGLWLCVVGCRPWQCGAVLCAALPVCVVVMGGNGWRFSSGTVARLPVLCPVPVVVGGDGVRQWWERGTAAQIRRGSSRQLLPYRGTASGCRFFARVGSSVTGTASGSPFHL